MDVAMNIKSLFKKLPHIILLLILFQNTTHAYDASEEVRTLVDTYLTSLSTGDLNGIRTTIGGSLLKRTERRLAEGEQYGNFLRNHYSGVQMVINSIETFSDHYKASVIFYTAKGPATVNFIVKNNNGAWLIVDENI